MEPENRAGCWPAFVMATVLWAALICGVWTAIDTFWPGGAIQVVEVER